MRAALSPAEVASVKILDEKEKKVEVVVGDDQLSLAIGKNGQNVRLASKLTGWSIDIRSKKEAVNKIFDETLGGGEAAAETTEALAAEGLESLDGVGPKTAKALEEAGYKTVEALKKATKEELMLVKGIGEKTIEKIMTALHAEESPAAGEEPPAETTPEEPAGDAQ